MISFWEQNSFLNGHDVIIVGSGIVGLSTAASLLEKKPDYNVLILDMGLFPTGASLKNAGNACYGTLSEVLWDAKVVGEKQCIQTVSMRYNGLQKLRKRLGDEAIGYLPTGGYEMYNEKELVHLERMEEANKLLTPVFGGPPFVMRNEKIKEFGLNEDYVKAITWHQYEGCVDTGKMMKNLMKYVGKLGARIMTGAKVIEYKKNSSGLVSVFVENPLHKPEILEFTTKNLAICTNAYGRDLIKDADIVPGRGQIILTKPIKDLKIDGTFHFDEGYYYFKSWEGRILFGGGRNLDFKGEETHKIETTEKITNNLKKILKEIILPKTDYEIDMEWAGIMAFASKCKDRVPILEEISSNVFASVRCNGMGIAISSICGENLSELIIAKMENTKF